MKGMPMRNILLVLIVSLLFGCGFQLRGSYSLPWETLYLDLPETDEIYQTLRRGIETSTQTRVVDDPKQAKATLSILQNSTHKNILSLSAKGRVREFQVTRAFVYQVRDASGKELLPTNHIILQRELSFDDTQIYAKEAEEAVIQKDLYQEIVQQLLRRLAVSSRSTVQ
jgi:LPS-assembly lipoprotein